MTWSPTITRAISVSLSLFLFSSITEDVATFTRRIPSTKAHLHSNPRFVANHYRPPPQPTRPTSLRIYIRRLLNMEFAENASNRSFSSHQHSWGLRDHWRSGMHVPHPRLGWFPLSVKGGVIRHWSMTSPREVRSSKALAISCQSFVSPSITNISTTAITPTTSLNKLSAVFHVVCISASYASQSSTQATTTLCYTATLSLIEIASQRSLILTDFSSRASMDLHRRRPS